MFRKQSMSGLGPDFECVGTMPSGFASEIRVLTLNDGEHHDSTLYRLKKGWRMQFRVGPSLFGKTLTLYTNHPSSAKEPYERSQYRVLKWKFDSSNKRSGGDDTAAYAEICLTRSGSFHYYFSHSTSLSRHCKVLLGECQGKICKCMKIPNKPGMVAGYCHVPVNTCAVPQGSGFFIVDPVLSFSPTEALPLDCVQCQTVLAKSLGPFNTWENKLQVSRESGYNMVHFTPIQELGGSNSSYSLSNQLKLNPAFSYGNKVVDIKDMDTLMKKLRSEWKMLGVCDIVLNHTANESLWLQEHPECTYNCQNSPHLRPAYLLDVILAQMTNEVAEGKWEHAGIPVVVNHEDHLNAIRHVLLHTFLPEAKISELYMADVEGLVTEFEEQVKKRLPPPPIGRLPTVGEIKIVPDPQYRRHKASVNIELALRIFNVYRPDSHDELVRLARCRDDFRHCLEDLNQAKHDEIQEHLEAAVDNTISGIRYHRVQEDGPRTTEISEKNPLVPRYFTDYGEVSNVTEAEDVMNSSDASFLMVHNGWVINSDPLTNFASPTSNVYVRREVIAWGDSVKLRFGEKPEDCPFLWKFMQEYVEQMATVFDGIRLDNCHSTPIPVAEYLLDAARRINPDLYVVAELFTNSDEKDNIFVNRLGITSLIREAMAAWDSHELGRLVHRYGGDPVGAFFQPPARPLVPSIAHALFLDQTHDNQSPVDKRSVFDLLPSAGLVAMSTCASGSNRGYDELVPHHIHVVDELREYAEWSENLTANPTGVNLSTGIIAAKRALNKLHFFLGKSGFDQVFVDQIDYDVVAVTRHRPRTHESVVLISYTAFSYPDENFVRYGVQPLRLEGIVEEVMLEAILVHSDFSSGGPRFARAGEFTQDEDVINGLTDFEVSVRENFPVESSEVLEFGYSGDENVTQLNFKNFQPGSVVAVRVSLNESVAPAVSAVQQQVLSLNYDLLPIDVELTDIIEKLTLADLNRVLYRCNEEERDENPGTGAFDIPNFGPIIYCGLQGFLSLLCDIRKNNDLGHPLCVTLRQGNYIIDYVSDRLKRDKGTEELGLWFETQFNPLKEVPRYLVPSYFDTIITGVYQLLIEAAWDQMSEFVSNGSAFIRGLALGSVQCGAMICSAPLPPLAKGLAPPLPPTRTNEDGEVEQSCLTMSAGLPHFTSGFMRCWGRDTFIAMRGLFILTGRYQEARYHILGFAGCLRHGLIPNLLDGGKNARFNCRDAVWWWMHTIHSYVKEVPKGESIFNDKVARLFPTDDSPPIMKDHKEQPLHEVIQEAMTVHFQGLTFRERNAGPNIDAHMTYEGFNNEIGIQMETGFVFGGNGANCGTWMDKMGSSDKAGIRGKPATSRDGSAIELVGLSKEAARFLADMSEKGVYPSKGITRKNEDGTSTTWTYREWEQRIAANFDPLFFVNPYPQDSERAPDMVHRRSIYRDCLNASQPWADYQLRPNFAIAMVAAPEMFDPGHAWTMLKKAEDVLLGPLGMKTLDPSDWVYNGNYDNSNDSDDPILAHGFNYHQGPEWLWPIGYFLRARLIFAREVGGEAELRRTANDTRRILAFHFAHLQSDMWRGLPELTNKDGSYCSDSCRTQAWSMSCLLEVLYDLHKLDEQQPINPAAPMN